MLEVKAFIRVNVVDKVVQALGRGGHREHHRDRCPGHLEQS